MKQLRAKGIQELSRQLRSDCVHLMRLSRDDEVLQEAFRSALTPLEVAETQAAELVNRQRERANA